MGSLKGVAALILLIIFILILKATWKILNNNDSDVDEISGMLFIGVVVGVITVLTTIGTTSDFAMAVKCKVAPRVVIVEKVADLARSMSNGTNGNRR